MRSASALLAFGLMFLGACTCKKPATEAGAPAPVETATQDGGFFSGTVTTIYVDDGCPFLVMMETKQGPDGTITGPETPELLLPIALDEKYLKSGVRLRFKYRASRASSGGCTKGFPAILEEVSVVP